MGATDLMSFSQESPSRSSAACKRCHNRKKKCDKTRPRCQACQDAKTTCSFEEEGEESAAFSVAYVRGLERRVQDLERQLQLAVRGSESGFARQDGIRQSDPNRHLPNDTDRSNPLIQGRAGTTSAGSAEQRTTDQQIASELETLSLQVADTPFLGPSSGVSFARLTQAVLRRLQPDQYSFSSQEEPNALPAPRRYQFPSEVIANLPFPSSENAARLSDFYWRHSHTLYPFLQKPAFLEAVALVYADPDAVNRLSSSWLYKIWMVFAIGSTTLSSIHVMEERESVMYFYKAMTYFESSLMEGNMVALEAILLQVLYSFFNQLGPNTWHLVGTALRIAIGAGLHAKPQKQLAVNVEEHRRRVFWSLYMMDRVVSIALGRPFGIRDEDIEIEAFADVDDENILPDRIIPQNPGRVSDMAVPLHILGLRKIAGEIFMQVYCNKQTASLTPEDRNAILARIHEKLVAWRRTMPFPLRESQYLRVPHLTAAWFDLNYYNLVIMLYRPSPLCPVLDLEKVHLIADASAMAVRQSSVMARQAKYSFNWLGLFQLFTATLTLMYSVSAQPDPLPDFVRRSDAITDLELAISLLDTFSRKFPTAIKCRDIVRDVVSRLRRQVSGYSTTSATTAPYAQDSASGPLQSPPIPQAYPSSRASASPTETVHVTPVGGSVSAPSPTQSVSYPFFITGNSQYDALVSQIRDGVASGGPNTEPKPTSNQPQHQHHDPFPHDPTLHAGGDQPTPNPHSHHGATPASIQNPAFATGEEEDYYGMHGALSPGANALFSTPLQMMLAGDDQASVGMQLLLLGQNTMDLDVDEEVEKGQGGGGDDVEL